MAEVEEDEFLGAGVGLDFKDMVPLSVSLVPYVVLWPSDLQQGADLESLFLVVIKRAGGLIGALPLGVISDREIASGSSEANPHALLGASTTIMVPGVYQNSQGVWEPSESEVALLVADFTADIAQILRPMTEDDTESFPFVTDHIEIFPEPSHVVSQVMEWLATQGLSVPEGPYQSDAQEVTAQSGGTPPAKSSTPRRPAGPKGAMSSAKPSPKPKRVTTAALAGSLEGVLSSFPNRDFGGKAGGLGAAAGQFIFSAKAVGKAFDFIPGSVQTTFSDHGSINGEESPEDPTACAYGSAVDTGACGCPCFASGVGGGTSSCRRRPYSCTSHALHSLSWWHIWQVMRILCWTPPQVLPHLQEGRPAEQSCRPSWLSTPAFSSRQFKGLWQDGCPLLWHSQS